MPTRPPVHRPKGWRPASRNPAVADPYYKSEAHERFRTAVLRRDGFHCIAPNCNTPGRGSGGRLIADHIIERGLPGSTDDPSNGRTLCPACDNKRHREKGFR
jgi:5-methylcytosine-specific restriction endonuclease McrA